MNHWLRLLTLAYHSDQLRPIVAALLVATGFALAALWTGPIMF